jgi:quercetin dioxygenase-like cupin family protein
MTVAVGFRELAALFEKRVTDKISGRMIAGKQGVIVWWTMKAGARAGAHSHPHEQIACLLKGKMEFRLSDERRAMGPGDVVVISSGVEHEAFFPEDTEVIDIFVPPRDDFLEGGTRAYMKQG